MYGCQKRKQQLFLKSIWVCNMGPDQMKTKKASAGAGPDEKGK